jgi:cytochrome c biogenesis protein CcdA
MLALAIFVVGVAAADAVNPSTIGPALYLAVGDDARRRVAAFSLGVFLVSAAAGLVLTLGPGQVVLAAVPKPGPHVTHLVELALGVAAFGAACALWVTRERVARRVVREKEPAGDRSFLLGAGIAAVELPTALPYFAVLTAIVASGRGVVSSTFLVLLFNLVFVTPLLAILAVRSVADETGLKRLVDLRARLNDRVAIVIPAIAFVAAVALCALGLTGLSTE